MYDWLIDTLSAVWRHGWSLTALGTAIIALLKQRKVKQQLRKVIPWLFGDDSEVKQYIQNQRRIESKIDALLQKEGIAWPAASNGTATLAPKKRTGSTFSLAARSVVRSVVKCIIYPISKGRWRMNKFKSRKFWLAVISAVLVVLNDGLGLGIDNNTVFAFVGIIMSFIFGEAYIDAKKVKNNGSTQRSGDSGPAI